MWYVLDLLDNKSVSWSRQTQRHAISATSIKWQLASASYRGEQQGVRKIAWVFIGEVQSCRAAAAGRTLCVCSTRMYQRVLITGANVGSNSWSVAVVGEYVELYTRPRGGDNAVNQAATYTWAAYTQRTSCSSSRSSPTTSHPYHFIPTIYLLLRPSPPAVRHATLPTPAIIWVSSR